MRHVPIEEARKQLGKLVRDVAAGEPVIIGRRGVEQAVLISEDEYERLRRIEEEHAARVRFREALDAISAGVRTRRLPQKVVVEALRAADVREGSPCPENGTEGDDVLACSYPHTTRVAKLPGPTRTAALVVGLYRGRHDTGAISDSAGPSQPTA